MKIKIYGYCRVSTKVQNIERQIKNILGEFQEAKIYQETYTGTTTERKEWQKLKKVLKIGDTIVFDSVSRMSRNSEEGIKEYFKLMEKGVNLIFLKEKYINTDVYKKQIEQSKINLTENNVVNAILEGIEKALKLLAIEQIKIAFDQAEKEVLDLRQRTKEGLAQAKIKGNVSGRRQGAKVETKKAKEKKEQILKMSKAFNGTMKDKDIIEILGIDRGTYYKYKRELMLNKQIN